MKGLVAKNKEISIQDGIESPVPRKGEVLIKVLYSTVNPTDLDNVNQKYAFVAKLMGAKIQTVNTGLEFSGIVEKDGNRFKKGDKVFGYVDLFKGMKTHQEYISISEDHIALTPSRVDFKEIAAVPLGALTSLVALEDHGNLNNNTRVLINGASGGLGVYAVQIARLFGSHITAVAGTGQESFLKSLGADEVVNYRETNLKDLTKKYDVIIDLTSKVKFSEIKRLLTDSGKFIPMNPLNNFFPIMGNFLRKKKVAYLVVARGDYKKLTQIANWVEKGKLKPIIENVYSFAEYQQAFDSLTKPGKRGRIVMGIG